ncbi:MAG: DUF1552 domain-containing protein [Myxococcales bacterium]|nr:DUF1552 domain-containing protein [Myxococcales bacterium]
MALSRRQLLHALGLSPTLPLLPSLLASTARAQNQAMPKFYVHFCTEHGGVWERNMYPQALPSQVTQMAAGRPVRQQPLTLTVANGQASLSPVLAGPSSVFTAQLASKMNVLQGLDWPLYLGHHSGGHLGNPAQNAGRNEPMGDGTNVGRHPRVTIDQLMGWSPEFYPNLSGVRERVMVMGREVSFHHANPAARTGAIQPITGSRNSHTWYDRLFPPGTTGQGPAPRPPPIAQVKAQYSSLLASPRRLSGEDRQRLEQHVQRLDELQRRLAITPTARCTQPTRSTQSNDSQFGSPYVGDYDVRPDKQASSSQMLNELITAAFSCGLSRVAVLRNTETFSTFSGDWHQSVAHRAEQGSPAGDGQMPAEPQRILTEANQRFFSGVFLDLAAKLEATADGQGGTLLDHSLLVWSQECGNLTHNTFSVPVITFGGASGYFRTGQYVDYRNRALVPYTDGRLEFENPGLFMHQWLGMTLRAMGVPHAQWAEPDHGGYGYRYANINWSRITTAQAYPTSMWSTVGDELPFLRRS